MPPKPNVFTLYSQEFGILTPFIADAIGADLDEYPEEWFEPAMRIAVERNARNWRYVQAILKRWKIDGFQAKNGKQGSGQELTAEEERQERQSKLLASLRKYNVET